MKQPSESLFNLVKSLSRSEKRHFRIFAERHVIGSGNIYLRLFDEIDRVDEYDENSIKKKMQADLHSKRFADVKSYLYSMVLKSLRVFSAGSTPYFTLVDTVDAAYILQNRGLYKEAWRYLEKARRFAEQNGNKEFSILILDLMGTYQALYDSKAPVDRHENIKQTRIALDDIECVLSYRELLLHINEIVEKKRTGEVSDTAPYFEKIIQHPLMQSPPPENLLQATLYYNEIYRIYHYNLLNFEGECDFQQRIVDRLRQMPQTVVEPGACRSYVHAVHNLCDVQMRLERFHDTRRSLEELWELRESEVYRRFAGTRDHVDFAMLRLNLGLLFLTGEYKAVLEQFAVYRRREDLTTKTSNRYLSLYIAACSSFALGDYPAALFWLNKILNVSPLPDLRIMAPIRILNVLVHIQLGNHDTAIYLAKSSYRTLSRKQPLRRFEVITFRYLTRLLKGLPDQENVLKAFRSDIAEDFYDPVERSGFIGLDLVAWIDSRLLERSMAELVHERVCREQGHIPVRVIDSEEGRT